MSALLAAHRTPSQAQAYAWFVTVIVVTSVALLIIETIPELAAYDAIFFWAGGVPAGSDAVVCPA